MITDQIQFDLGSVPLSRAALFLDLDGTLTAFAERPDAVLPDPRRTRLLERAAAALDGRVAVVSGRSVDEVDRITGGACMAVGGVHGLQRRDAEGRLHSAAAHPGLEAAQAAMETFASDHEGLLVEAKGLSVALHYRRRPEAGAKARRFARDLAASAGLALQEGSFVSELRTPGADKGDAVRAFLGEAPFAGAHPIFVGDDLTDEAGFEAATEAGGLGVIVGERVPTAALWRLAGAPQVLDWLEHGLDQGAFTRGQGAFTRGKSP